MFLNHYENVMFVVYFVLALNIVFVIFVLIEDFLGRKKIKSSFYRSIYSATFILIFFSVSAGLFFKLSDNSSRDNVSSTNQAILEDVKYLILKNLSEEERAQFLADSNMIKFDKLRPLKGFLKCGNKDTKQECLAFIEKTINFYKNERYYKQDLQLDFEEYQDKKNKE
ncbi:hypothetical protein ACHJH3_06875 [Campylobacter sp. MOP7]|uniref:hypothetical protein n=1 Tax=Campylobacter canis TaxID=3378588 RepID=UPI00387E8700